MDTNVLRLKGRLTLILSARADTFGLINEKKTRESKKIPRASCRWWNRILAVVNSGRVRARKGRVYARAALLCDELVWANLLPRVVASFTSGAAFNMSRWPLTPGQCGPFIAAQCLI